MRAIFIKIIVLIALFTLTNSISTAGSLDKISLNGKWFVDSAGRVQIFRGVNAVQKSFPWFPDSPNIDMTNRTQLLNLQKWGFNVVRLGSNSKIFILINV